MGQNKYTQVIDCWDKTMNVQKPRKETAARKAPVQVEIDLRNNMQVVDSETNNANDLAIDETATRITPLVRTSLFSCKKTLTKKNNSGHPGVADLQEEGAIGDR